VYYYYGWGLFLWPVLLFFLMYSLVMWWPDRIAARKRLEIRGKHRGRGPKGYRRTDERIAEDVNDRLTESGDVDATDVDVLVSGGSVILRGRVETRTERHTAEWIAESVPGVREVRNELKVAAHLGDQAA
jgi:osmotically-inducible protein OsmY